MKATAIRSYNPYAARRRTPSRYPNAAEHRFSLEKLADFLLAGAITFAMVTILLFLLALG